MGRSGPGRMVFLTVNKIEIFSKKIDNEDQHLLSSDLQADVMAYVNTHMHKKRVDCQH